MDKKIFDKKSQQFLYEYLNNASPTSHEYSGQKIWLDYLKNYVDTTDSDPYGTCFGIINPKAKYKVAIEAHADEISWMVHYISDDGYLYVLRNGGMDAMIAPSKRVYIHTAKGKVDGVVGWTAIHLRRDAKDEAPQPKHIFIDCGCSSREEVEALGIHVGCVITYTHDLMELNNGKYFCGRAMDNGIGGFMIAQVARLLHENKQKLPFGLYIINSVQEEVGLRGAQMIAERIRPNVAIITDVSHDTTTPRINKQDNGDFACGKGPILTYGPAVHNKLLNHIIAVAEKENIPFQREAASRATGTDTDAFAYAAGGIPSALISLPLKYMHTTVEMAQRSDIINVIKLMYHSILSIENDHNFKYL
ncbi:MAG: M20/M25/M40 family metallo-hydrolase [Chitinophagales bacterium]|nr:M20/M25/M40 family metallo-hydrolase [Bacteroidota bacterium]MCB9044004.1 M20/M25/M40 family metallo-hydrolase [Chitinophagales bacterium]